MWSGLPTIGIYTTLRFIRLKRTWYPIEGARVHGDLGKRKHHRGTKNTEKRAGDIGLRINRSDWNLSLVLRGLTDPVEGMKG